MTITIDRPATATLDRPAVKVTHPYWCDPARCRTEHDGNTTRIVHQRVMGSVAGVEVLVEQIDTIPDGKPVKRGTARGIVDTVAAGQLDEKETIALANLAKAAGAFGRIAGGGVH